MSHEEFPDEVPEADAAEQARAIREQVPDEEAAVRGPTVPPTEATAHDWQEQTEDVEIDADEDDFGRDT